MTNATQRVFDATASTYDHNRARLIPGCDSFYRWAVDLIPSKAKRIVELGAGSGLLTMLVRQRFPEAALHLMDFSAPMLALAQKRLGEDTRISYEVVDYAHAPLPGEACAVISSLSIHHLEDAEKQALFARVYQSLKPRGAFINAEQVAGPTESLEQRYRQLWLEQVRAAGASEEQIEASLLRQQEDRSASVENQLQWMRAAGFTDADCWYKENRFAVLSGTRNED